MKKLGKISKNATSLTWKLKCSSPDMTRTETLSLGKIFKGDCFNVNLKKNLQNFAFQTALRKPTKFCMTLPMTKWTGLQLRPILGPNQAKRPGVQGQLELCLLPRKGANLWPWEAFQARNIRCKFCGSIPTIPIEKLSLTASYVQISYSYNPFSAIF